MTRRLLAIAMCLWLLLSGAGVYALAALEHVHDGEHASLAQHDASDHQHADTGTELFSQLLGQPAFDQLTSSSIAPRCAALGDAASGSAPLRLQRDVPSVLPVPPPGPPPRPAALHRGGVLA
jgi:hypothetical protein